MKGIRILNPGIHASIQDIGRVGYRAFGLPSSGVMDSYSFYAANQLAGNDKNEAVIESLFHGLKIEFFSSAIFAVCGAEAELRRNGKPIQTWKAYRARRGDIIEISRVIVGARNYISFSGGFRIDPQLGSLSTYTPAGIGGSKGRELQKSDILPLNKSRFRLRIKKRIDERSRLDFKSAPTLRILPGVDSNYFDNDTYTKFLDSEYTVSQQSDRMGIRLIASEKVEIPDKQIISYGIHPGTIQIPRDGNPIIMGADCQTTGGYHQIANILDEDLSRCGQLIPGDKVRFKLIPK